MSFLWDSLYSVFARTRNYLVDPPGEENSENPELAITGEGRGATTRYHKLTMFSVCVHVCDLSNARCLKLNCFKHVVLLGILFIHSFGV